MGEDLVSYGRPLGPEPTTAPLAPPPIPPYRADGSCVVERHRSRGTTSPSEPGPDASLHAAVYTALQLYVDRIERAALPSPRAEADASDLFDPGVAPVPTEELEGHLLRLLDFAHACPRTPSAARATASWEAFLVVTRALFGPPEAGAPRLPQWLWRLAERDDEASAPSHANGRGLEGDLLPVAVLLRRAAVRAAGPFVKQSEAARRIGVSPPAVQARVNAGRVRAIRIGGRVLVSRPDVDRWKAARPPAKTYPTSPPPTPHAF